MTLCHGSMAPNGRMKFIEKFIQFILHTKVVFPYAGICSHFVA